MGLGSMTGLLNACNQRAVSVDIPQIALQLYSVRSFMEADIQGTLARVAKIGIRNVETAFWPEGLDLSQAGQLLRDTGLNVVSAHVELPFGQNREIMLRAADAYDSTRMVWHGWPEDERYATMDGVYRLAELYNEAHAFAAQNGLQLYLHNHWWEFEPVDGDAIPYYVLLERLDPSILFEIDTWWVKVAGQNPAQILEDFGPRAPLLHIKDGAVINTEGPMVAVGQGLQDFPAIAEAGAGYTDYMIIELDDCDTDMFEAIAQSYTYLEENRFARSGN